MITILDKYTQISFNKTDDSYNYTGTCNIKENQISNIEITISTIDSNNRVGAMSSSSGFGASVTIDKIKNLTDMQTFVAVLQEIKNDLETEINK